MDLIIRNFQFVWLEYALIYTTINNLMKNGARDSGIKWYNNIETRETVSNLDVLKFLSLVFLAHTLIVVDIQNR